ncbi:MAG: hypothetical protein HYX79_01785 [Chloroflexi bacterium]|nr:hypothetical protein [Chloroflexota bacterium]
MNVLKGLALGILGFLLFVALSFLGLVIMLNQTVLKPDFVIGELEKLDVTSLAKEQVRAQVMPMVPAEFRTAAGPAIDNVVVKLEPWAKQQVNNVIYRFYDYLLGKTQEFSLQIPIGEIKGTLHDTVKETFLKSPPPQFANLPPALLEQGFEQAYSQIAGFIPQTYPVNESMIPAEARSVIRQVKTYIGYYQTYSRWLIPLIVLLVLGIVLLHRSVKRATRELGVTALVVGGGALVELYLIPYLLNRFLLPQLSVPGVPAQLQTWLSQLLNDLFAPIQLYAVWLAAAGVILLVVSFIYKPTEEQ